MKIKRKMSDGRFKETVGGLFSQRLSERKTRTMPCEEEALATRCLIHHNRSFLCEYKSTSRVFSDNLPVCQAWKKMKMGIWPKSSKVASLLTNRSIMT